jgi:nicotinamide-nucleotide amidase
MKVDSEDLTRKLAAKLRQKGFRLCTAESCTGGLIAKTLTDLAGSSTWFDRGFVTYSNQAKIDMLGVQASTLEAHGAVSTEVAQEMAAGALMHSEAQVSVAVTGIAGPDGGSPDKPVGTVCFAFAIQHKILTERQYFEGDRARVRDDSLIFVLTRLNELLR